MIKGHVTMNNDQKLSILFVCMGNICRSPTAEGVFRARAQSAGILQAVSIDSAGTHAYHVGARPDLRSQEFAAKRGLDLSGQRARQVSEDDFARFDFILAMDKHNLALLEAACPPNQRHKLALFMTYATHSAADEVPDPYHGGEHGFDIVLDYIEDASDGLVDAIHARINSK
jgi:protein-tyrosine phosphatase